MGRIYVLVLFAAFSPAVPILIGTLNYRRLKPEMRILIFLFFIGLSVEGMHLILTGRGLNPYWTNHVYIPIEYVAMMMVFTFWQKSAVARKMLLASIPLFLAIGVLDIIFGNLKTLSAFTSSLTLTVYVAVSSYTLIQIQKEMQDSPLRDYRFWALTAILINSAGGLAYFAFNEIVVKDYLMSIYLAHTALGLVSNALYAIAFILHIRAPLASRQPQESLSPN